MSADNGYVVRLHPEGGFAIVMYFASADYNTPDGLPMVDPNRHQKFNTIKEVFDALDSDDYWSEYGYHFDAEVQAKLAEIRSTKQIDLISEYTDKIFQLIAGNPFLEKAEVAEQLFYFSNALKE